MGGTRFNLKTLVKSAGGYHYKRWNVGFSISYVRWLLSPSTACSKMFVNGVVSCRSKV